KTDAQLTLETTELARGGKGAVCPDVRIRLVEPVRFRFRTLPNARRVPPARPARNSGSVSPALAPTQSVGMVPIAGARAAMTALVWQRRRFGGVERHWRRLADR